MTWQPEKPLALHHHYARTGLRLVILLAFIFACLAAAFAQTESDSSKSVKTPQILTDLKNEPLETLAPRAKAAWEKMDYETAIPLY